MAESWGKMTAKGCKDLKKDILKMAPTNNPESYFGVGFHIQRVRYMNVPLVTLLTMIHKIYNKNHYSYNSNKCTILGPNQL